MITEQYKVLGDLGSGATAEVKLVQDITTSVNYACKLIKTGPNGISEKILTDV